MLRKVMIALMAILCLLSIPLSAQKNNYRCVDHSLQKVYKQVTGVSLEEAVDSIIAKDKDTLARNIPDTAATAQSKKCEFAAKSSNPNLIYIPDEELIGPEITQDIEIFPGKGGTHLVGVIMGFAGNIDDVKQLVNEDIDHYSKTTLAFIIPLEKLPKLCQVKGVIYIEPAPRARPELNYSTDDIDCRYAANQDTLGVSGKSVVLGIIDTGIDWLHKDFIDSNGNTRIKYFWDQTDQTGPNLINN